MSTSDHRPSGGSAGRPKLVLRDISCAFGSTVAVDRLSLEIAPGEFVTLLGPSGCGKTTTLRIIAGFIQRVGEILRVVRMEGLAGRYPAELSGGQQQRVALVRAIVIQPEIPLLDELLSNLDANLREEMRFEIRRRHDEFKITTVYVTHDQAEAMVISDRIAVMNQGRVEQADAPYALYTRPKTRFVAAFIGRTNFLQGACHGEEVRFDRFAIRRDRFENGGRRLEGSVLFSLRPQSIFLHREAPADPAGACLVEGRLEERAYLG